MKPLTPQETATLSSKLNAVWWHFFDWVAIVSWPKMLLFSFLAFLTFAILSLPSLFFLAIVATLIMKVLAGGKRRAELIASAALEQAKIETLERQLLEAKIAALQAQIEPHFLFNTLALIGQLIEVNPPEAARVHRHLINYLRSAIPQMRSGSVTTLGAQIELSRAYLEIMRARMGDRLNFMIEVPPNINDHPFPPMMLQSLVENAIQHGLEPKVEGGTVSIHAQLIKNYLCVDVKDNGMGFNVHAPAGTGLTNIRERLAILYSGKAELLIEIPTGGGTIMSLRIPC